MAEEQGYTLGKAALRQVGEVVRRVLRQYGNDASQRGVPPRRQAPKTVVLDAALAAASDALTGAETVTASVLRRNSSGDLEDAGYNITVVNRNENISLEQYTLAIVTWLDGEWRVTGADCTALGNWP